MTKHNGESTRPVNFYRNFIEVSSFLDVYSFDNNNNPQH